MWETYQCQRRIAVGDVPMSEAYRCGRRTTVLCNIHLQADVAKAERARSRKVKASRNAPIIDEAEDTADLEPPIHSDAWLSLQSIKEIPRKVFKEVMVHGQ